MALVRKSFPDVLTSIKNKVCRSYQGRLIRSGLLGDEP